MRYREIYHQAKQIDQLIDNYIDKEKRFPTREKLGKLLLENFSVFYVVGWGRHKVIFGSHKADRRVVLKIGPKRNIESDHHAYKAVPEQNRHQFFAKIYWHTRYCMLQEYGLPAQPTPEQIQGFRYALARYGIVDIKATNLCMINGGLRLVDANVTRLPMPIIQQRLADLKRIVFKKLGLR
ncbi:MAG: hypothetical protein LBH79_02715 [Nitrososphaerota archaeon]|nr:hypothetical protein [Nitrososphaerota archaeon]